MGIWIWGSPSSLEGTSIRELRSQVPTLTGARNHAEVQAYKRTGTMLAHACAPFGLQTPLEGEYPSPARSDISP